MAEMLRENSFYTERNDRNEFDFEHESDLSIAFDD